MKKIPSFKIKIPTPYDELEYVGGELLPKYALYFKSGYLPKLPEDSFLIKSSQKGKRISKERLKMIILKFYNKDIYENAILKINSKIGKIWLPLFKKLSKWNKDWEFKIFPHYEIRLTKFGIGGDYFPSYGAFDGKFRSAPGKIKPLKDNRAIILLKLNDKNYFSREPLEVIIHEIIHLGIEESIVRKFNLNHTEKEKLVDNICFFEFSQLLPNYKCQNLKMEKNFHLKESLKELPKFIKKYLILRKRRHVKQY